MTETWQTFKPVEGNMRSASFEYINIETNKLNYLKVTTSKIVRISKADSMGKEETLMFKAVDAFSADLIQS